MLGIDIVYLPEFKKRLKNSLDKVFLPIEMSQNTTLESLAGIFAGKEAFFKATGRKENWLEVWIEKDKNGKPQIFSDLVSLKKEISISHAGDYAVAAVFIYENAR